MLVAIIHHQNNASKRVVEKVGMKWMKQTYFNNVFVDIFSLSRGEVVLEPQK
jgi:RimJ/RimL family protein N-acetyltransferase